MISSSSWGEERFLKARGSFQRQWLGAVSLLLETLVSLVVLRQFSNSVKRRCHNYSSRVFESLKHVLGS